MDEQVRNSIIESTNCGTLVPSNRKPRKVKISADQKPKTSKKDKIPITTHNYFKIVENQLKWNGRHDFTKDRYNIITEFYIDPRLLKFIFTKYYRCWAMASIENKLVIHLEILDKCIMEDDETFAFF